MSHVDQTAVFAALRWPLESAALCLLTGSLLMTLLNWNRLPERIPAHFGITGRPDRWGGRWHLLLLLAIGLGLYAVMSAQGATFDLLTGDASPLSRAEASLLLMKVAIQGVFALSLRGAIRVALGQAERLNIILVLAVAAAGIVPAMLLK